MSAPEIYLTGRVERNGSGQDKLVHVMQPIPANSSHSFVHEATLHIHDVQGTEDHDYYVLVGPDYEAGTGMDFEVRTSTATLYLTIGWAMLVGQLPVAETDLVSTSAVGTLMALRVVQGSRRQNYVYNLEPATSQSLVKVVANGQTVNLQPGTFIVVKQGTTDPALPIPPGDKFVADMRSRAAVAEFDTAVCPCP